MNAEQLKSAYEFINSVIDNAGEIMKEGFYGEKKIEEKRGPWDLVTDYDKKVEDYLMSSIKKQYPTHRIIAEEDSAQNKKSSFELTEEPTWIIDPIDGTSNYAQGLPLSTISVALAVAKQVEIGIVYNPVTNHKYTARRGMGAFENGIKIFVNSKREAIKDSMLCFELGLIRVPWHKERNTKRFLALAERSNGVRDICSAAITLCFVAKGALDAYFSEYLNPWDIAAGVLIIQEAGGYVCSMDGKPVDIMKAKILVASTQKLAEEILKVFEEFP